MTVSTADASGRVAAVRARLAGVAAIVVDTQQASSGPNSTTGGPGGLKTAMGNVDRDAIAADWRARGFSCGLWVDPPGQVWADFVHETDELVMVIEGDVEVEIEGRTRRPRPGEEIYIPAGARHTVRNVGATTSRWLYGYRR